MKAANIKQIKDELRTRSDAELEEICLRLAKFKKENKELMTYLLFEAGDEQEYITGCKEEMEEQFAEINRQNYYFIKKGIRKILTAAKRHIRYSQKKETEVVLLIHFCQQLKAFSPSIFRSQQLENLFYRQAEMARKKMASLHEDLQYDYGKELEELTEDVGMPY